MISKAMEQSMKAKVRQIAQSQNLPFNEIWNILIMERFLARLSHSNHKADFIFKGGRLLAQYVELHRETKDLDFLIRNIKQDAKTIENAFKKITDVKIDDGFAFKNVKSTLLTQEHMKYPGLRISMMVTLGGTKTRLLVDVGFGDIVEEKKLTITLLKTRKDALFEDSISLQVYPPEFIFAEKLEAAVFRGILNSRMKDYHDMYFLISSKILKPKKLAAAVKTTFKNRDTVLKNPPLNFSEDIELLENRWSAHLRVLDEQTKLPEKISDVISHINNFFRDNYRTNNMLSMFAG